jgi:type IV pilus assembly protein PilM
MRESAVKANQSVFAIPLSVSFATVISLQATMDEDLDSRIRVEARKYIPIPLSEVTLDWAEIEKTTDESKRNVLLAAIQNKPLERFNNLLTSVKLFSSPTEIECFSTIRGAGIADKETTAVIDFGATTAKLYIVRKGLLQRMYRVPIGMAGITTEIAKQGNQSFAEAETLKKVLTTSDESFSAVQKIYANHFRRPLVEFSHVLTEYTELTGASVETIVLSGSGVLLPEFPKLVEETVGVPVIVANPFNLVAYPAFMEDPLKDIGPIFTTALGAALRQFI